MFMAARRVFERIFIPEDQDHTNILCKIGPPRHSPGEWIGGAHAHANRPRQFNLCFPQILPQFVQHAVWRYCSQSGLAVCNGNRIDDAQRCANMDCQARLMCDRAALRSDVTATATASRS
jgi:hypothetical protein